jgi:hypothetical protein
MSLSEDDRWLVAGRSDPDFVQAVREDIEGLRRLEVNWDGYGAPVIDPAVMSAAKSFIASLPDNLADRPRVVPMSNGTLQLEWSNSTKSLEFEFESPTAIHFLQWQPSARIEEEGFFDAADISRATELLQWLMFGKAV